MEWALLKVARLINDLFQRNRIAGLLMVWFGLYEISYNRLNTIMIFVDSWLFSYSFALTLIIFGTILIAKNENMKVIMFFLLTLPLHIYLILGVLYKYNTENVVPYNKIVVDTIILILINESVIRRTMTNFVNKQIGEG